MYLDDFLYALTLVYLRHKLDAKWKQRLLHLHSQKQNILRVFMDDTRIERLALFSLVELGTTHEAKCHFHCQYFFVLFHTVSGF